MANDWFRLYADFASNPKIQVLPETLQRRYVMLLCMKCAGMYHPCNVTETLHETDETLHDVSQRFTALHERYIGVSSPVSGSKNIPLSAHDEEVALYLRISVEEWLETKKIFIARSLLNPDGSIYGWEKRQYISDLQPTKSTERVRRYRQKNKVKSETLHETDETLHETLHETDETPTDTDTDTDTDTEYKKHTSFSDKKDVPVLRDSPGNFPGKDSIRHDKQKASSPNQGVEASETDMKPARLAYPLDFERAWSQYPRTRNVSKKDAFKAWNARLREGVKASALIAGVERYARFVAAKKVEERYIKLPATFFGPGEHYLCDWTPDEADKPEPKPWELP